MRLPIRTRLTLAFAGITAVVLAVATAALLLGFRGELTHTIDEGLLERAASLSRDPRTGIARMGGADEIFAQLQDGKGAVLVASPGLGTRGLPVPASLGSCEPGFLDQDIATPTETIRARIYGVCVEDGSILLVGQDVDDQREAVARLTAIVAVGGPILLLAMAAVGWTLAGAGLRPVERLRAEAATIQSLEPSRRLAVPDTGDELQRLAETLNGMLDRLHEALDRERRLVDEASHELRTPLGVLQAEVDLALKEPRGREELEAALRSIAQETARLRRLTLDLLVLARSDRGRLALHRTDVAVSGVVDRAIATFEERAAARGVHLRATGDGARARVDADRIRQAIENLLDNALRHTVAGDEVEVRSERRDGDVRISVIDTGTGFPEALLARATEPFARGGADRDPAGAGLGLAIVRAVAEAHGGTVSIRNRPAGGASVTLDLPA
jgi:two-component system OmpR family sensor kinase